MHIQNPFFLGICETFILFLKTEEFVCVLPDQATLVLKRKTQPGLVKAGQRLLTPVELTLNVH